MAATRERMRFRRTPEDALSAPVSTPLGSARVARRSPFHPGWGIARSCANGHKENETHLRKGGFRRLKKLVALHCLTGEPLGPCWRERSTA